MGRAEIVYVVVLRNASGFQRRLFFGTPQGTEGRAACGRVRKRAEQMRDEPGDLVDQAAALRACAAEHGLRSIAH